MADTVDEDDKDWFDCLAQINGMKGQHSKMQQKLAIQVMHMFYNVRNAATLSDVTQSTKSEVRYSQDVHTSTIIRWF